MKDRYLFRGKSVNGGEWITSMTISYGHIKRKRDNMFMEVGDDIWKGVIPDTVGQCTGLKDKNGKLIFEGDIIEQATMTPGYMEKCKETVVYDNRNNYAGFGYWDCSSQNDGDIWHILKKFYMDKWIIIGNIHDEAPNA